MGKIEIDKELCEKNIKLQEENKANRLLLHHYRNISFKQHEKLKVQEKTLNAQKEELDKYKQLYADEVQKRLEMIELYEND